MACLVAGLLAAGCGPGDSRPASQTNVELGQDAEPEHVALSDDGTVWATGGYWSSSILRIERSGKVTDYPTPPSLEYPQDIVQGPDGAMWFAASDIGRIDSNGTITSHQLGRFAWPEAIAADDEGIWYPKDDPDGRVMLERMSTEGVVAASFLLGRKDPWIRGMALGRDGAVWLTQADTNELSDSIGRMTVDGRYTSWRLPQDHSGPERITAGPDGALWFTEQAGQRIGRITTAGKITEFPLEPGLSPFDITAGADGALWFSTDTCLGRITTEGRVSMFPVEGAVELVGIAAVPDSSFWLADRLGHALRHVLPPEPAAAESDCRPPTLVAQKGATRAVLTYKRLSVYEHGEEFFTNGHIRISRRGEELLAEVVPNHPEAHPGNRIFGYTRSALAVRDIDGDGEPEVLLRFNWNGTHCCEWSRIYRFDEARSSYVAVHHFWGNADASPTLRDLDEDGRPEFISKDDRFAQLTGYAGHMSPVQVWSYHQGEFSNVTRSHPKLIEGDAARLWRFYVEHRGKGTVRYVLAAWAADELMLGRSEAVEQVFAEALGEGYLAPELGESEPEAYVAITMEFLRETGYIEE